MYRPAKGFTLVELLVVITIIAILATIGLVVYGSAQKQARIAKRVKDLGAIQTALELYYSVNKTYPKTADACCTWRTECSGTGMTGTIQGSLSSNDVVPSSTNFVPNYMVAFPSDPQMDVANSKGCYFYASDSIDYKVLILSKTGIVDEIGTPELQANFNLWDPYNSSHPQPCTSTIANRKFAIYSSTTSRCW